MTLTTLADLFGEVLTAADLIVPEWSLFVTGAVIAGFLLRFIPRAIKRFM